MGRNFLNRVQKEVVKQVIEVHLQTVWMQKSRTIGGPSGTLMPPCRVAEKMKQQNKWTTQGYKTGDYVFCHNYLSQHNVTLIQTRSRSTPSLTRSMRTYIQDTLSRLFIRDLVRLWQYTMRLRICPNYWNFSGVRNSIDDYLDYSKIERIEYPATLTSGLRNKHTDVWESLRG